MANNKTKELSAFEKELYKTANIIREYKMPCEANIVSLIYKNPDILNEYNLERNEFTNNQWRVYFEIASEIIQTEKKNVLDEFTVSFYLDKHLKLKKVYDESGGYDTISNSSEYIKMENLDGYIEELRKWNTVLKLAKVEIGRAHV